MSNLVIVPLSQLSTTAQTELIEEYVTRDSCVWDGTLEEKRERVLNALRAKEAVITFDLKNNTADIRSAEQLRGLRLSNN